MRSDPLRLGEIRRTSAFRLTVLLGSVFAVAIVLLLGLVYVMTARELIRRNDKILRTEASRLLAVGPVRLPHEIDVEIARTGLTYAELISEAGERIVGNIAIDHPPRPGHAVEVATSHGPVRLIAFVTPAGETVIVGRDVSQVRDLRRRILIILLLSGSLTLIGSTAAAIVLADRPLRRVRDLEQAAREIGAGRFEMRMPIAGYHDELDQIAGTVNRMVDELGRVMAQVKGVTDAVAHDLRTPLGHVRAHLLRIPGPAAEAAIADLDLVLARFAALLRIAEIEAGARRARFTRLDLADVAEEAIALYEPLAEEAGIALSLNRDAEPAPIEGDRELLIEAVSNLVDNAIKFAASRVRLSIAHGPDGPALVVRDNGGGIPPAEREAVLRRFHRGTNAGDRPGAGLGLSIVAAIAHLHGMELRLDDAVPGLAVTLLARAK